MAPRPSPVTAQRREDARRLRAEGLTQSQIASRLGVTQAAVSMLLSGRWSSSSRAHASRKHRLKMYGLTQVEYDELLAAQDGACAICGGTDGVKSLAVDHCHETDRVRGLLCTNCNTGIGSFRDDPELLIRAINYIRACV